MNKLTGHGHPNPRLVGEVGQHYEDLDTGDIYECRVASKYSPTHGWPVGGYVWERRAKGEDMREIYSSDGAFRVIDGKAELAELGFDADAFWRAMCYQRTSYAQTIAMDKRKLDMFMTKCKNNLVWFNSLGQWYESGDSIQFIFDYTYSILNGTMTVIRIMGGVFINEDNPNELTLEASPTVVKIKYETT